jgi:hypothetical protein
VWVDGVAYFTFSNHKGRRLEDVAHLHVGFLVCNSKLMLCFDSAACETSFVGGCKSALHPSVCCSHRVDCWLIVNFPSDGCGKSLLCTSHISILVCGNL